MNTRHSLMFAVLQLGGSLLGIGADHVDRAWWLVSALMLLPGMIVSMYVFRIGGPGNGWPKWSVFAVAVSANVVLLTAYLLLRRWRNRRHGAA